MQNQPNIRTLTADEVEHVSGGEKMSGKQAVALAGAFKALGDVITASGAPGASAGASRMYGIAEGLVYANVPAKK